MSEPALKDLELMYLLCDRFSHELRTPLGVALGVMDDYSSGLRLQPEDWVDAHRSLKNILGVLEEVRELGAPSVPVFRRVELPELCGELSAALQTALSSQPAKLEDYSLVTDMRLLLRTLRALERFLLFVARRGQASRGNREPEAWGIEFHCGIEAGACCLWFGLSLGLAESEQFSGVQTIREIAEHDHSASALNMLFVDAACRALGVSTRVGVDRSRRLWFSLLLPTLRGGS